MKWRAEIDRERFFPICHAHLGCVTRDENGGDIAQCVEPVECLPGSGYGVVATLRDRQVRNTYYSLHTQRFHFAGHGVQPIGVDVYQTEVGAHTRKPASGGTPQPRGGSGDERSSSCHVSWCWHIEFRRQSSGRSGRLSVLTV